VSVSRVLMWAAARRWEIPERRATRHGRQATVAWAVPRDARRCMRRSKATLVLLLLSARVEERGAASSKEVVGCMLARSC
jgi:hypothetical protein